MRAVEPSIRSYSIRGPWGPRLTREGRHHARGEDEEPDEVVTKVSLHCIGRGGRGGEGVQGVARIEAEREKGGG